jgi:hypothetical protein
MWDKQVGGHHYTDMKLQPLMLTYMVAEGDSCFCKVAKYIARAKCYDDLQKAVDVIEKAKELRKAGIEVTHYRRKVIGDFADQFDQSPKIAAALITFLEARYDASISYVESI